MGEKKEEHVEGLEIEDLWVMWVRETQYGPLCSGKSGKEEWKKTRWEERGEDRVGNRIREAREANMVRDR